jgi:hypothetical protein
MPGVVVDELRLTVWRLCAAWSFWASFSSVAATPLRSDLVSLPSSGCSCLVEANDGPFATLFSLPAAWYFCKAMARGERGERQSLVGRCPVGWQLARLAQQRYHTVPSLPPAILPHGIPPRASWPNNSQGRFSATIPTG